MATPSWSFGGVNLNTFVFNIEQIDAAHGLPDVRGENVEIPFMSGKLWTPKLFDERVVSLGMWIAGNSKNNFEESMDSLKALFGRRNRQMLVRTMADGSKRQALAEVTGTLGFSRLGPAGGKIVVDFSLADPFFRSDLLTQISCSVAASPTAYVATNPGTGQVLDAVMTLTGPLANPKIANSANGVWLQALVTLGTGETAVVNCADFTVVKGPANIVSAVRHAGHPRFFVLEPGDNGLTIESAVAGGSVEIAFYAPYL